MTFEELDEFQKDLKKLLKKYRTLEEDLATVKQILTVLPDQRPPFSFRIDGLGLETCVIKVKKIAFQPIGSTTLKTTLDTLIKKPMKSQRSLPKIK